MKLRVTNDGVGVTFPVSSVSVILTDDRDGEISELKNLLFPLSRHFGVTFIFCTEENKIIKIRF